MIYVIKFDVTAYSRYAQAIQLNIDENGLFF